MKQSNWILSLLIVGAFASLMLTDIALKNKYLKLDKNNPFWNYETLKLGKFSHVKVDDNRSTWVVFRPSANASVGVLTEMAGQKRVEVNISNDTLFVKINHKDDPPGIIDWLSRNQLVCITAPELKSVTGTGLAMEIKDLNQNNLHLALSGDSRMSVETLQTDFDNISVNLQDSAQVKIQMARQIFSAKTIHVKKLQADIAGKSMFDASQLVVDSMQQKIDNIAAIALNGSTLGRLEQ